MAELHVLVCQRYRLCVRRGDHEADTRGADGISSAVCHLPDVPAVLLQGVVGSAGYLALGDRNGQRPQVRMCLPPPSTCGATQHLPHAENSCPAAPSLQRPALSRASACTRAGRRHGQLSQPMLLPSAVSPCFTPTGPSAGTAPVGVGDVDVPRLHQRDGAGSEFGQKHACMLSLSQRGNVMELSCRNTREGV